MQNDRSLSPSVYTTPPRINVNYSASERIVEIARQIDKLTTELVELTQNNQQASRQSNNTVNQQQSSTTTSDYQRQSSVGSEQPQGEAQSESIQRSDHQHIKREEESTTTIAEPKRRSKSVKSVNKKKSGRVSYRSTKYSSRKGPKQSAPLHSATAVATTEPDTTSAEHFKEGDKVQLISDTAFIGQVGEVVKVTAVQLCIRFGSYIIYRKKKNVRKLNF